MRKTLAAAASAACIAAALGTSGFAQADDASTETGTRPDFSGNWTHRGNSAPATPVTELGTNVCVLRCADGTGAFARAAAAGGDAPESVVDRGPNFPTYREEHVERVAQLNEEQVLHDTALRCLNPGLPRIGPFDKIVQTDDEIIMLYDDLNGSFWRIIPTDGREHKTYAERNFFGDSVGHWEGDKLIIESVSFNTEAWLTDNGAFHSENMRIVEEIFPAEGEENAIVYRLTVHDPEVLAEPWTRERLMQPRTSEILETVPCVEESIDAMTDITSYHPNSRW